MRKIATIAAFVALATVQAGTATAQPAQTYSAQADASADSSRNRLRAGDPVAIGLSLAALTTFILGFVAAIKKNGGQPASP